MGKVISMINWKGGVGKTTLTLHLGIGLQRKTKKRVLLVDLDPQCNLSFLAMGVERYKSQVYDNHIKTLKDVFDNYFDERVLHAREVIQEEVVNNTPGNVFTNIDMILSHQDLVLIDQKLARTKKAGRDFKEEMIFEIGKLAILDSLIKNVKENYDYVLVDCPPNVNFVTQNAFYASDYFVVPAIPDFLSTTGISLITKEMDKFNNDYVDMHSYTDTTSYKSTEFGGIIFNMVDEYRGEPKATHSGTIDTVSEQQKPGKVFKRYITDGDGVSTAASLNLPIFSYDHFPRSRDNAKKQAESFDSLADEFIERIV